MPDTANLKRTCAACIASDLLLVLPLIRKKLLNLEDVKQMCGLPMTHVHLLAMLKNEGPATVSEIAARFQIAKPNITPLVDRLVDEGLVVRVRETEDRRIVYVHLQESGEARLNEIIEATTGHLLELSDRLSPSDYTELGSICARLVEIIGKTVE